MLSGVRQAMRLRETVHSAQAEYLAAAAKLAGPGARPPKLAAAIACADVYAQTVADAAAHLRAYPSTRSFLDLGELSSPERLDVHERGLRLTAAAWRDEAREPVG